MRIIADHFKGSVLLIQGGIEPSNKLQGYFLRRLLRRVTLKLKQLNAQALTSDSYTSLVNSIIHTYQPTYFADLNSTGSLVNIIVTKTEKFEKTLAQGLKLINRTPIAQIDGKFAFDLYQSYGFPLDLTQEIFADQGLELDQKVFTQEFKLHQERSRTASQGMFKGGLADHSDTIVKYHTTTHLLHQALRQVLGDYVSQMGSNITAERLRFDFKHPQKLTAAEMQAVETIMNQKAKKLWFALVVEYDKDRRVLHRPDENVGIP